MIIVLFQLVILLPQHFSHFYLCTKFYGRYGEAELQIGFAMS